MTLDLTVMILSYNEIINIEHAIDNVCDWAEDIIVLDSGSTDGTIELARAKGCKVFHRDFDNFSQQRKYLLNEIEVKTEWIFVLDADEYLTAELKDEIANELRKPKHNAYTMNRRFYWMGQWVKRGYYPTVLLRLGRYNDLDCDDREINEHIISKSNDVGHLQHDFVDYNRKGIKEWVDKHNGYSDMEADALFIRDPIKYSLFGGQYSRKRWVRVNVWNKLPPVLRPFMYFFYRFILMGGVLDGKKVAVYHFLHAFLYRVLIDFKYLEKKWRRD